MQHITIEQLINGHISQGDLVQLCDSDDFATLNTVLLDDVNAESIEEIYSYLRGVYLLPLASNANSIIRSIVGDIMVYRLYKRRGINIPESILDNYKLCVSKLKDIRNGNISMDMPKAIAGANDMGGSVVFKSPAQKFGNFFTKKF